MAGPLRAPAQPRQRRPVSIPASPIQHSQEPEPESAPPAEPREATMFRARRAPIHHPYQNVLIPVGTAVPLIMDNWVEVQLAAKVIERS